MKDYFEIVDVLAREVYTVEDKITIEAEVTLDDGTVGRACVSAAMEEGKPSNIACENVNTEIAEAILGLNALDQSYIDAILMEVDGDSGRRLGTNATMAASVACAKAAAESAGLSLYSYLGGVTARHIPEMVGKVDERRGMKWYPTLTAMLDDLKNYDTVCSGTCEDPFMAHVAVASGAKKLCTLTTCAKNEIIRIKEELELL